MKRSLIVASLSALTCGQLAYAQDYNAINESVNDNIVEAGDVLAIALPATGLFASLIHQDLEGAAQLTISVLAAQGITEVTKNTVGRYRPNSDLAGASYKSFPSGHAAGAFSGAAFLQTRYGAAWGIPAYAAATFVAASRVHGNRHYADDVLGGASIGFLVNQLVVSPYVKEGVSLTAGPSSDGGVMFGVSVTDKALQYDQGRKRGTGKLPKQNRHRFQFDVGFNMTDSVDQMDDHDLLPGSKLVDDHQPFSSVIYEYTIDNKTSVEFSLMPSETRRYGTANGDFSVDNTTYSQGSDIYLAFKQWSAGGTYYHHYQINDKLNLSAGVGLYGFLVELEADHLRGGNYASEGGYQFMPSVTGKAQYKLIGDLYLQGLANYQTWGNDQIGYVEAGFNYAVNKDWELGLKYTMSRNEWRDVGVKHQTNAVVLSFANRF
ncbi:phosphatase PAP2 family protein [Vibrio europaeus]|uniref:phosphatase PAP2 family protein n=1 Tax=Vibrio europaeus TaxID=300876 RepID=UPI00233F0996|nr:phosphatase PAP2 family protein [Vibrio europaeus]MDC5856948.1 phosphatase PAP2 family protein [Vibrio europaeus]